MKTVKQTAPAICEICGNVFQTKYAFICPKCRKKIASERAKKINLSKIGNEARWKRSDTE
jgi:predicted RNA-binding Zn-ribbon protein involved in translation (DUF1610 family)